MPIIHNSSECQHQSNNNLLCCFFFLSFLFSDKLPEEQEFIVEGKAPEPEPPKPAPTTQDSAISSSTAQSMVKGPGGDTKEAAATNGSNAGPSTGNTHNAISKVY